MDPFETFLAPIWPIYGVLRVLLIFVNMVLFFVTIYAGVELFSMRPHFVHDPRKPAKKHGAHHGPDRAKSEPNLAEMWQNIRSKADEGTREAVRIAIIEADGFVDNLLKKRGYSGETFADRVQGFTKTMKTIDRLWDAHRIRNDIVHTPDFEVSAERARITLDNYEAFLVELGAFGAHRAPVEGDGHGGHGAAGSHEKEDEGIPFASEEEAEDLLKH